MSDIRMKEMKTWFKLPVNTLLSDLPIHMDTFYFDGVRYLSSHHLEAIDDAINNHDRLVEENTQLKADNAELVAALECLESLTDIWLPSKVSPEFEGEAEALHRFRDQYLSLIRKHTE